MYGGLFVRNNYKFKLYARSSYIVIIFHGFAIKESELPSLG